MSAEDEVDAGHAEASLISTSMPLCDSRMTASGSSLARISATSSARSSSRIPKVQLGMKALRVGDRRVGKGLADDRHAPALHLAIV
jgi:hypothetical protein